MITVSPGRDCRCVRNLTSVFWAVVLLVHDRLYGRVGRRNEVLIYSPGQTARKLLEADPILDGEVCHISRSLSRCTTSVITLSGVKTDKAKRLSELGRENRRLKRIVAQPA